MAVVYTLSLSHSFSLVLPLLIVVSPLVLTPSSIGRSWVTPPSSSINMPPVPTPSENGTTLNPRRRRRLSASRTGLRYQVHSAASFQAHLILSLYLLLGFRVVIKLILYILFYDQNCYESSIFHIWFLGSLCSNQICFIFNSIDKKCIWLDLWWALPWRWVGGRESSWMRDMIRFKNKIKSFYFF